MIPAFRRLAPALVLALLPGTAFAHTGLGDAGGFAHGLAHPLGGLDHVLAMLAVGLVAAHLGGRALALVPLAFLGIMGLGGALGGAGLGLPHAEAGIALSVVVLGAAVALRLPLPTAGAMALVGLFAVFHGHAHGAEMPETTAGLAYGAGFMAATALLHAAGVGIGLALGRAPAYGAGIARGAGAATALAGVALLVGVA